MNRSFIVAVLTVTMIIMMSTAGYALVGPHNLACDNCHGKFVGTGRAAPASNACVTCHSSMGEASRMPIEIDADSNYYGTDPGVPATGSRSTHTWLAGNPNSPTTPATYNPAAMVREPVTNAAALNAGYGSPGVELTNTTLCIRCHNAKASTDDTRGVDKPYLRAPNTNDNLCRDCHAARDNNTSSTATGTHPIYYRAYSTVYKLNTTAFRKKPLSPNANNPTANPGNYLTSNGKIVCTTCHAPHYADSNSATLDNRSTANGSAVDDPAKGLKGSLQNSKGQLLRTDPIGSSASAINICSSCHKETKNLNHNAKGQNVQCDHCHSAHVDYTGDASAKNLYLVRRNFSNISISSGKIASGKIAIYNTATSLRFMRNDGKGICQVCHTPTPGTAIHDQLDTRKADCLACHTHVNGFTAAACDGCHGQPPAQGKAAPGYTALDEAFTPHVTHADKAYYNYACKNCHYSGTRADLHRTSPATFQSVFNDTAGSVGDQPGLTKNIPAHYDATNRTCSLVYCHSDGNPRVASPGTGNAISWQQATTPSWANGKNKILNTPSECTTCHQSGPTLVTNAHYKHVTTNAIKCYVCHYATVTDVPSIKDRSKHANGTKDVVFVNQPENYTGGAFSAAPFNYSDATCTNSCHSNGQGGNPVTTPKWTDSSTGACGKCHPAVPLTNKHSFHFTDPMGPLLNPLGTGDPTVVCVSCHIYAPGTGVSTHANGVADLKATPCAPCHPGTSPFWSLSAKVTCESCHTTTASVVTVAGTNTYTAPLKALNKTVGHGQYSSATVLRVICTSCHNASAPHIGASPTEKRLNVAGNALCNTCHIKAKMGLMTTARADLLVHGGPVNKFTKFTSASNLVNIANVRSDACAGCHDTHGTTNLHSIRTTINGRPIAFKSLTSFYVPTKTNNYYNGLCQACHTKTKYYRNYTSPAVHNPNRNCLDCHQHKGHGFAFSPGNGTCNGCHGYPPAENMTGLGHFNNYTNAKLRDYAGGGGAHTVAGHRLADARATDGAANYSATKCNDCHYNTFVNGTHGQGGATVVQTNVNVVVDPQFKFNNTSTIRYNANKCSNVSCHFKSSPNWVTSAP
jgi:predicted CxxxxCH...CXXCH cytochrome family protein